MDKDDWRFFGGSHEETGRPIFKHVTNHYSFNLRPILKQRFTVNIQQKVRCKDNKNYR